MNKVIRDGRVAVLYSPGFGAGWYSWHSNKELLFHPKIVELVQQNRRGEITKALVCDLLGIDEKQSPYLGGADELDIEWVPIGTAFRINEYDGSETVIWQDEDDWIVA
jgi:hypothetical protein